MEKIIEFIGNNYAWFLTITIILLFALIGYIYDNRKTKTDNSKNISEDKEEKIIVEDAKVTEKIEDIVEKDSNNEDPVKLEEINDKKDQID